MAIVVISGKYNIAFINWQSSHLKHPELITMAESWYVVFAPLIDLEYR
jgi:hypothetical protein